MKEWYNPSEIVFTKPQVIFLLNYLPELRDGEYPPECVETGYTGSQGRKVGHHAPFEVAAQLAVEIDVRLQCTSTDGELLFAQVKAELPLSHPANMALKYISGWRRKQTDYHTWCRQCRYRHKLIIKA